LIFDNFDVYKSVTSSACGRPENQPPAPLHSDLQPFFPQHFTWKYPILNTLRDTREQVGTPVFLHAQQNKCLSSLSVRSGGIEPSKGKSSRINTLEINHCVSRLWEQNLAKSMIPEDRTKEEGGGGGTQYHEVNKEVCPTPHFPITNDHRPTTVIPPSPQSAIAVRTRTPSR
jgi:hypothetical protein